MSLASFHKFFIGSVVALGLFLSGWFGGWVQPVPQWGWFGVSVATAIGGIGYLFWFKNKARSL